MSINNIFGRRLKNAREMKGYSLADLAKEMSNIVSRQAIYKYESGQMLPDSTVLLSLSAVLGVKADYFFRPFETNLNGIEFRKKAKLSVKDRIAIERNAMDNIERYLEIENLCECSRQVNQFPHNNSIKRREDVIDLVSRIRKNWGLGKDGIPDVIALLESKGVIIIEFDAPESFDGLSGMVGDNIVIILNKAIKNSERKRFTTLHELGHLVMSFDEGINEREKESLCHLFASEFLSPQESFESAIGNINNSRLNMYSFADVQRSYGISIDALMRKAAEAKMISEYRLRSYHIFKNQKPAFKAFVERSIVELEHPERFNSMVFGAYYRSILSASKAAMLLNIPVSQVIDNALYV